jgi:hypothetical protein
MRMKLFGFMLAIIVSVSLGWCLNGRGGEQKEDKETYKSQMDEKLKRFGGKLDELKARTGEVKEDARKEFKEQIVKLEKKHKSAKTKLEELKRTGEKQWKQVKSEVTLAAKDLEDSYNKVIERFKN